jgi:hypothetical protein
LPIGKGLAMMKKGFANRQRFNYEKKKVLPIGIGLALKQKGFAKRFNH